MTLLAPAQITVGTPQARRCYCDVCTHRGNLLLSSFHFLVLRIERSHAH